MSRHDARLAAVERALAATDQAAAVPILEMPGEPIVDRPGLIVLRPRNPTLEGTI